MADTITELPSTDPLLNRFFLSPQDKNEKSKGKAIVRQFYSQQTASDASLNFFRGRNARWVELLLWSKGSQNMKEFLDFFHVSDANKSYVNIDMTQQRIAAQFVGTLVESMAKNKTYSSVNAIDDGSLTEKEQRYLDSLFRMHEVETIKELQQSAGVQLEPTSAYVPDDEISAKVHFELEDRLPKEIRFEQMIQSVRDAIHFDRIANRRTLGYFVKLNFGATRIERIFPGKYTVRVCEPTNMAYNFFMNDSGEMEVSMVGEFYNMKVKDFRSKFGKSAAMPNGLSEKEIWDLAKSSTMKNNGIFNFPWDNNWGNTIFNQNRPYDDFSIYIFDTSVNCCNDAYFVVKTDTLGREDITPKKGIPYSGKVKNDAGELIPQPKPDDVEIMKRQQKPWMRGVYAPYGDTMIYWGEDDLIINEYTDIYCPKCPYTLNIPNNDGDYVPSLFERIMEPLKEYTITKLKRKQLIAQLRPSGIRIDVESARNIDLGNGDSIGWEEVLRIFNQTGTEVYSSKGLDPLQPAAPPIGNTAVDDAVQKILQLTNVLAGIVAEIRQLIGVPQYRDGSDVGDRTSGVLQEQQTTASFNVTDFISNANDQLWEETFYKLCLLHWNDVVKKEPETKDDMLNTRFQVTVTSRSVDYQKELLEKDIDRYSQVPDANGNPSLTPKDANILREIDNGKLARWYLTSAYDKNRREAIADKSRATKENADAQNQSLMAKAQQDSQMQDDKLKAENDQKMKEYAQEKELAVLNGIFMIAAKGLAVPEEFKPVINLLVPNVSLPLVMENKQMGNAMQIGGQASQMPPQGQSPDLNQPPTDNQEQPDQSQLQPQQQPQMVAQ